MVKQIIGGMSSAVRLIKSSNNEKPCPQAVMLAGMAFKMTYRAGPDGPAYLTNMEIYPSININSTITGNTYDTYTRAQLGNFAPLPASASAQKFFQPQP